MSSEQPPDQRRATHDEPAPAEAEGLIGIGQLALIVVILVVIIIGALILLGPQMQSIYPPSTQNL